MFFLPCAFFRFFLFFFCVYGALHPMLWVVAARREAVMGHVNGVIAKLLSKGLMQFEFAHDLLWEYMQEATPVQMQVSRGKVL